MFSKVLLKVENIALVTRINPLVLGIGVEPPGFVVISYNLKLY